MEEKIPDNQYRLEIERRNPLQAFILRKMLGEKTRDHKAQEEWATEYGKRISDIIDTPAHEEIRAFARAGNYEDAAELVIKLLEEENDIHGS